MVHSSAFRETTGFVVDLAELVAIAVVAGGGGGG